MTASLPRKKLIEVALPLDEINIACKADKDRKTGTLRNLHKWFAPMPLPAWRALLFAALIDDPSDDERRAYLLDVIKRLVENKADLPNTGTLAEAQALLLTQFPDGLPLVMDPFCGGGSTLVEAQRLGLETFGSDLNPIPALISRTLTELLPKVHGGTPLHRGSGKLDSAAEEALLLAEALTPLAGYNGLAQDVRHYARLVSEQVYEKLGKHYPVTTGERPVAWIWARTGNCPNPSCRSETVLATSWWLSKKPGERAWVEPRADGRAVVLDVVEGRAAGEPPAPPKAARGAAFICLVCTSPITEHDLDTQAKAEGLGTRLIAVVTERGRKRRYAAPTEADLAAAAVDTDSFDAPPTLGVSDGGTRRRFGLDTQADLYLPRQLATLSTFADLTSKTYDQVVADGGSEDWATAVATLLGLAVGKLAHGGSSQNRWKFDTRTGTAKPEAAFGRNDLPFTWDFAEAYPFGTSAMSWAQCVETMLDALPYVPHGTGTVRRADARSTAASRPGLVATDPPYFEAIAYADLSDFFYVWHRRALRRVHPDLYDTVAAPKTGELTALPVHHGGSKSTLR